MAVRRSASAVSSPASRREPAELLDGVAQPFGLAAARARRRRDGAATAASRARRSFHSRAHLGGVGLDAAIGVEQSAMGGGVDEGAVVMLAVDFHQRRAERAQHLHADRLVVDESAGAAVGELHAPHDQLSSPPRPQRDRSRRARGAPDDPWRRRRRRSPGPARRPRAPARHRRARRAPAQRHRAGSICRRRSRRSARRGRTPKSMSSRSIRTMSRMERRASMSD